MWLICCFENLKFWCFECVIESIDFWNCYLIISTCSIGLNNVQPHFGMLYSLVIYNMKCLEWKMIEKLFKIAKHDLAIPYCHSSANLTASKWQSCYFGCLSTAWRVASSSSRFLIFLNCFRLHLGFYQPPSTFTLITIQLLMFCPWTFPI